MKINELGEFGLISLISRQVPPVSDRIIKGIGDDTAVLDPSPGKFTLLTTDMLMEEIHFSFRYCSYRSVGWKALAVNVSDVAAMGGLPAAAVVSLGIPSGTEVSQIEELYQGLGECAVEYGVSIVGGDTVKSHDKLVINITLMGEVEPQRVIYRNGARPDDVIMVTGPLGCSAAGLYALNNNLPGVPVEVIEEVVQCHLFPGARLTAGRALSASGLVSSMNDISDGLASEVLEICQASGTGCELDEVNVPFNQAVADIGGFAGVTPGQWALYGGEDFELVFTVRPGSVGIVETTLQKLGCHPAVVGRITQPEKGCILAAESGNVPLQAKGYNHFRE